MQPAAGKFGSSSLHPEQEEARGRSSTDMGGTGMRLGSGVHSQWVNRLYAASNDDSGEAIGSRAPHTPASVVRPRAPPRRIATFNELLGELRREPRFHGGPEEAADLLRQSSTHSDDGRPEAAPSRANFASAMLDLPDGGFSLAPSSRIAKAALKASGSRAAYAPPHLASFGQPHHSVGVPGGASHSPPKQAAASNGAQMAASGARYAPGAGRAPATLPRQSPSVPALTQLAVQSLSLSAEQKAAQRRSSFDVAQPAHTGVSSGVPRHSDCAGGFPHQAGAPGAPPLSHSGLNRRMMMMNGGGGGGGARIHHTGSGLRSGGSALVPAFRVEDSAMRHSARGTSAAATPLQPPPPPPPQQQSRIPAMASSSMFGSRRGPFSSFFKSNYGEATVGGRLPNLGFLPQAILGSVLPKRRLGGGGQGGTAAAGAAGDPERTCSAASGLEDWSVGGGGGGDDRRRPASWWRLCPPLFLAAAAACPAPTRRGSSVRRSNKVGAGSAFVDPDDGGGPAVAAESSRQQQGGGAVGRRSASFSGRPTSTSPHLRHSTRRNSITARWASRRHAPFSGDAPPPPPPGLGLRLHLLWCVLKGDHLEDRAYGLFLGHHGADGGVLGNAEELLVRRAASLDGGGGGDLEDGGAQRSVSTVKFGGPGGSTSRSAFKIHPYSALRVGWNRLLLLLVVYTAVWIPFWVAFRVSGPVLSAISFAADAAFGVEVVMSLFFTGFMDRSARVVFDTREIATRYVTSGWFFADVLSAVPIEFITPGNITFLSCLKLVRLARLRKMARGSHEDRSFVAVKMLWLLLVFVFVSHWCACGFVLIGTSLTAPTWITEMLAQEAVAPGENAAAATTTTETRTVYIRALFTSVLILVGNGAESFNDSERIFITVVTVLGRMLEAVVVGSMAQLVLNMNRSQIRHQEQAELLAETVNYLGVAPELQGKIREHFSLLASCGHPGREGLRMMDELSPALNALVRESLYGAMVESVPMFQDLDDVFLSTIVRFLKPTVYNRGETVFRRNDVAHSMHFLLTGSVAVLDADENIVATLGEGDHFGEIALIAKFRRSATVITLTVCDICSLSYEDLTQALVDFPEEQHILAQRAEKRIAELTQLIAAAAVQEAEEDTLLLGGRSAGATATFDAIPREHLSTQAEGAEEGPEEHQEEKAPSAVLKQEKKQQEPETGGVPPRAPGRGDDWVTMDLVTPLDPTALRNPGGGAAGETAADAVREDVEALQQSGGVFAPVASSASLTSGGGGAPPPNPAVPAVSNNRRSASSLGGRTSAEGRTPGGGGNAAAAGALQPNAADPTTVAEAAMITSSADDGVSGHHQQLLRNGWGGSPAASNSTNRAASPASSSGSGGGGGTPPASAGAPRLQSQQYHQQQQHPPAAQFSQQPQQPPLPPLQAGSLALQPVMRAFEAASTAPVLPSASSAPPVSTHHHSALPAPSFSSQAGAAWAVRRLSMSRRPTPAEGVNPPQQYAGAAAGGDGGTPFVPDAQLTSWMVGL